MKVPGFEDLLSIFGDEMEMPEGLSFGAGPREAAKSEGTRIDAERQALAETLFRAFSTEDGRAALKIIVRMTLIRPESAEEVMATDVGRYAILKAERAGQNHLVHKIFQLLRVAQHGGEGPPNAPGGDT